MRKLPILFAIATVLILPLIGCATGYTQAELDEAYERGYEKGLLDGYDEGYDEGEFWGEAFSYDRGYEKGYDDGYEQGDAKGYNRGYDIGYEAGEWDWEQENAGRFLEHYQEGYDDGYWQGYEKGLREGDWEKLRIGYSHALDKYYELAQGNPELLQIYYGLANEYDSLLDDHYAGLWEGKETNSDFFVEILSVTSPVSRGNYATLEAQTIPGALCGIDVYYKTVKSEAFGLFPHYADNSGSISWSWLVGGNTTPGKWEIVVTAYDLDNWLTSEWPFAQDTVYFEVQ